MTYLKIEELVDGTQVKYVLASSGSVSAVETAVVTGGQLHIVHDVPGMYILFLSWSVNDIKHSRIKKIQICL